jgi:hypothetical protein
VIVVLSQVLADLVNGEFMQMQTKVKSTVSEDFEMQLYSIEYSAYVYCPKFGRMVRKCPKNLGCLKGLL